MVSNDQEAIVVDPGDAQPVLDALAARNLKLTAILLTHHHQDHVGGVQKLVEKTDARVFGPANDNITPCDTFLLEGDKIENVALQLDLTVLDVPGHTAGHIAYAGTFRGRQVLFCGDTLFAAGCGRIFEGTPAQMDASLSKLAALPDQTQVFCAHEYTLSNMRWARVVEPDNQILRDWQISAAAQLERGEATVPSTIRQELACNPFLRARQPDVAQAATQWAQRKLDTPVEVFAALREWKNSFR